MIEGATQSFHMCCKKKIQFKKKTFQSPFPKSFSFAAVSLGSGGKWGKYQHNLENCQFIAQGKKLVEEIKWVSANHFLENVFISWETSFFGGRRAWANHNCSEGSQRRRTKLGALRTRRRDEKLAPRPALSQFWSLKIKRSANVM